MRVILSGERRALVTEPRRGVRSTGSRRRNPEGERGSKIGAGLLPCSRKASRLLLQSDAPRLPAPSRREPLPSQSALLTALPKGEPSQLIRLSLREIHLPSLGKAFCLRHAYLLNNSSEPFAALHTFPPGCVATFGRLNNSSEPLAALSAIPSQLRSNFRKA